jgi:hypothetical protein
MAAADHYIDYEHSTIPLGDLPIGARVVDRDHHPTGSINYETYSGALHLR